MIFLKICAKFGGNDYNLSILEAEKEWQVQGQPVYTARLSQK